MQTPKTVLRYPGAKWVLAPWIVEHLPAHNAYLEPFFGSGAVLFNKPKATLETVNDLDGNVVNLWRVIREQPEQLARGIALTPWAREEYLASYHPAPDATPLERARVFLVRCWQAYASQTGGHPGWRNANNAGAKREVLTWLSLPERIQTIAERLVGVQIEQTDALGPITRHSKPGTLIYADPPYLADTRLAGLYATEAGDAEFHLDLLTALRLHPGPVVLSGYAHPLYDAQLSNWRRVERTTRNARAVERTEVLWIKDANHA